MVTELFCKLNMELFVDKVSARLTLEALYTFDRPDGTLLGDSIGLVSFSLSLMIPMCLGLNLLSPPFFSLSCSGGFHTAAAAVVAAMFPTRPFLYCGTSFAGLSDRSFELLES